MSTKKVYQTDPPTQTKSVFYFYFLTYTMYREIISDRKFYVEF